MEEELISRALLQTMARADCQNNDTVKIIQRFFYFVLFETQTHAFLAKKKKSTFICTEVWVLITHLIILVARH